MTHCVVRFLGCDPRKKTPQALLFTADMHTLPLQLISYLLNDTKCQENKKSKLQLIFV